VESTLICITVYYYSYSSLSNEKTPRLVEVGMCWKGLLVVSVGDEVNYFGGMSAALPSSLIRQ